jgi:hypothetical protein
MISHIRSKRMMGGGECRKNDGEHNYTNIEAENWMEENRMNKSRAIKSTLGPNISGTCFISPF